MKRQFSFLYLRRGIGFNLFSIALLLLPGIGCSQTSTPPKPTQAQVAATNISTFEECVAAGNPITKSLPPQCHSPDGRVFVKRMKELPKIPAGNKNGCKDLCGDAICQEIVCMALGCPCPESHKSCPTDCK